MAMAAEQTDDATLHRQLALFDLGIVEGQLETLLQVECLSGQGVAQRAVGDGGPRHGDDERIGRWLSDVDVSTAGMRPAATLRRDVAVTRAEYERDRRRRSGGGLYGNVHRCSRRHRRFLLSRRRQR